MSEEEIVQAKDDDAIEMIYEDQEKQLEKDTIKKLENREEHSVLEASMVKGEPLYPHEITRDGVFTLYIMAILFYLGAFIPPPLHESADPTAGTASSTTRSSALRRPSAARSRCSPAPAPRAAPDRRAGPLPNPRRCGSPRARGWSRRCPRCSAPLQTIVVHGHETCLFCKSNIMECCTGDTCETDHNLTVGYRRC